MLELPNASKDWNCGQYWEDGEKKIRADGCGQLIYKSTIQKFASGKFMVLNAVNGIGGKAHDPHVCPNRVGGRFHHIKPVDWAAYHKSQENKFCGGCLQTFNSYVMPLCPTCFKLECSKCGNMQTWVAGKGVKCYVCGGSTSVREVFNAYQRLYGKYQW